MAFCFTRLVDLERIEDNDYYTSHYAKDAATILPVIWLPKSYERLWLQSTDPFELSYTDPKFYIHPDKCQNDICWNQKFLENDLI